jgi:tetratricopeptide (TPR) repeat protein
MNAIVRYFYYDLMGKRERQAMHRRAGEYYETEEPHVLRAARHFQEAREHGRAAQLATANIWTMINQGQARPLRHLLERFSAQQLDPVQWAALNIARGEIYMLTQETRLARESHEEALSRLAALPHTPSVRELQARACRLMGDLLIYESPQDALDWLHRGLAELAITSDTLPSDAPSPADLGQLDGQPADLAEGHMREEGAILHLLAGSAHIYMGDYPEALHTVQTGLELLPEGPSQRRVTGLINLGVICGCRGDLERGKAFTLRAFEISQQLHDHFQMITILDNLGSFKCLDGDWEGAIADYQQGLVLAERLGSLAQRTRLALNLGSVYLRKGDHAGAGELFSASLDTARKSKLFKYVLTGLIDLADLHLHQGKPESAAPLLTEAEHLALEKNTRYQLPEIYRLWAKVQLAGGQSQAMLEYAERSVNLARDLQMPLEEGASLRTLGQGLLASERHQAALAAFEESLVLLANDPYQAARTKMQWGLALNPGESEQGMSLLREARATFEALGAQRDLTEADDILERLRAALSHPSTPCVRQG